MLGGLGGCFADLQMIGKAWLEKGNEGKGRR